MLCRARSRWESCGFVRNDPTAKPRTPFPTILSLSVEDDRILPAPSLACATAPLPRASSSPHSIRACRLAGPCSHYAPSRSRLEGGHDLLADPYATRTDKILKCAAAAADLGYPAFALGVGVPALSQAEGHGGNNSSSVFFVAPSSLLKPSP